MHVNHLFFILILTQIVLADIPPAKTFNSKDSTTTDTVKNTINYTLDDLSRDRVTGGILLGVGIPTMIVAPIVGILETWGNGDQSWGYTAMAIGVTATTAGAILSLRADKHERDMNMAQVPTTETTSDYTKSKIAQNKAVTPVGYRDKGITMIAVGATSTIASAIAFKHYQSKEKSRLYAVVPLTAGAGLITGGCVLVKRSKKSQMLHQTSLSIQPQCNPFNQSVGINLAGTF